MTPERWQQIKPLLQSALNRDPDERSAFLDEACKGDKFLRQQVDSFIISHEQAGGFLEEPAFEVMAESINNTGRESIVGQRLGHYQIIGQLGAGGMGEVYLAEDTRLGRKVAVKMLPAYITTEDERVRRFQQEARAASALNHPNIITIYEIGEMNSRHFMATEFIEGETLFERLKTGVMKISDALEVAVQATSALCAAHQAGIVHRDIKPGNIMLRTDGIVKVLDFGLATLTDQKGDDLEAATLVKTKPGIIMGSAHYMSPEQARGQSMDVRTDIFSLGVVLYQMVTGRVPFAGQTMTDVLASILMLEPPSLSQSAPEAPEELQRIVHNALRKDKEERYQTAGELLTDLKALKQHLEFEWELKRSNLSHKATSSQRTRRSGKSKAIDSLAVLPLINASADHSMDYFSDGVTESIINALSQLPKLRVVARGTAFRYKGEEVDPKKVGQQLGVRAVLTGRVRQVGDELMVAAELIDVMNDSHLWGEHYSRKLSDIFAVQEEIAKEISDKLRIKLTPAERKRLTKRSTESTEAYQLYLKGRFFWNKRTEEGLKQSIEYFQQAKDKDPAYAAVYAGLSDSYALLALRGLVPAKEAFPKARAAARKALEIDDALGEAYASLAHVRLHEWDWVGLEEEFQRALKLNPGHSIAYQWYAEYLMAIGKADESIAIAKQAQEIDPLSPVINANVASAFYFARQYDQGIEHLHQGLELTPNHFALHLRLGQAYLQKRKYEEAIQEMKAATLTGKSAETLAALGQAYAAAGLKEELQQVLDELNEQSKKRYVSPYYVAKIYASLGEREQAFTWLERAYEERNPDFIELKVEPLLDPIRSDDRFQDLLFRVGLAPPLPEGEHTSLSIEDNHTAIELTGSPIRAAIPLEQEIRFCTTADGVRIAYATVGEGPPLVKAANWLNHLEFDWRSPIWRHLLEEFGRDHLLVRYDERGNGLSDWNVEQFTFESFVQDMESVVAAVGLKRFPILGISQGGPVAIAYAVRHPEKVSHLILYGSYARGWGKRGLPSEAIERMVAQQTLIKFGWGHDNPAFRQLWTTLYVPDATPEQWQWFNDLHRVSTSPDNAIRLLNELGNIDVVDLLSQVKVPTLVLHCRDEVVVPFEEGRLLAGLIPGARFVPLEGRNHLLLESEPAWPKFVTEVRRFLEIEQFEAKPELSQSPDSFDIKARDRHITVGTASVQAIRTGEIPPAPVTSSGDEITHAPVTSSAEYVVGEIKRYKMIVAAIAAIVFLLIAGLVYSYFTAQGRTIDSLAVLPFLNASGDPNTEYLSDGIAESIIYSTSQLAELRVTPRSSVFRYKGKEIDPQTVGRELGVSAVLTGRVIQRGDDLTISAELVDLRNNRVLWGQQYTRKIGDILAIQEEIAREISQKLRLRLTSEDEKQLAKRYTENAAAYQLYLKGRYYWYKRTRDGYKKALEHFDQAIQKDPSYALAYTGLADCYNVLSSYGIASPKESFAKGKAAALKARDIDSSLAEARTSLAYIKYQYDWDFSGAEKEFKESIELNPNYATAHQWYALQLAGMGRMEEATLEITRAQEIDPTSLIANVNAGWIFYHARQYDRAIEQMRKSLEMDPNFARGHWAISEPLEQKQRYEEAIAELQKARQLDETPIMLALLGHVYALTGKRSEAQKIIGELDEQSKRMYVDPYFLAQIHTALGDPDKAFQELEKAYEEHSSWLVWLKVEPKFDSLRSDPRFTKLVQRIGLP
jgi:eukaryotic-like serine/threonine-protein kinase